MAFVSERDERSKAVSRNSFKSCEGVKQCRIRTLKLRFDDRLRFDDEQSRAPVLPEPVEEIPEQAVLRSQLRLFGRPVEDDQLLAKREILGCQFEARCEEGA